jgi:hypothetical protein
LWQARAIRKLANSQVGRCRRGCMANLFAGFLYFIESRQAIFGEEVVDRLDQKLLNLRVSLDCYHI